MRISDWSSDVCSSDLLLPEMLQQDLTGQIAALQPFHDDFVAAYAEFARRHGVHIIAPSLPVQHGNVFVNRSYLLAPKDRKSVVEGKSVSVRVDIGGRRILKKKNKGRGTVDKKE